MNIEEYRNRIESAHTITGIPSYWSELQEVKAERDHWRQIAIDLAASGRCHMSEECNDEPSMHDICVWWKAHDAVMGKMSDE